LPFIFQGPSAEIYFIPEFDVAPFSAVNKKLLNVTTAQSIGYLPARFGEEPFDEKRSARLPSTRCADPAARSAASTPGLVRELEGFAQSIGTKEGGPLIALANSRRL
jgi:hypothetical protein